MRVPRRHIRIRIDRWLHPGGHRVPLPQDCKLLSDWFPEMVDNHNPSRRQHSIRLLWRTGRPLDSDPEGRPRRILDRTPPTRMTTRLVTTPHSLRGFPEPESSFGSVLLGCFCPICFTCAALPVFSSSQRRSPHHMHLDVLVVNPIPFIKWVCLR